MPIMLATYGINNYLLDLAQQNSKLPKQPTHSINTEDEKESYVRKR